METQHTEQNEKIAVVTGANKGLGFGTAQALAERGYSVILVGRNQVQLGDATRKLQDRGLKAEAFRTDVTNENDIKALAQHIEKSYGKLDALVNNAGIIIEGHVDTDRSASTENVPAEIVLKTFETNTLGPYMMFQHLRPLLEKSAAPRVVNVSSGMGQLSDMEGGFPAYRISKTALNAFTRLAHAEYGGRIKVNSVCPGWVRTDMGGKNAHRSIEEGIQGILWAATLPEDGPSGGYFRDGQRIDW